MLVRIVKLTFRSENITSFGQIFEATKDQIRNTEGCLKLELYQDKTNETIFFTYSHWTGEEALDAYRNSDFFKSVWAKTRKLFSEKPEAWSVDAIHKL